jgi:hypothetical protein
MKGYLGVIGLKIIMKNNDGIILKKGVFREKEVMISIVSSNKNIVSVLIYTLPFEYV